MNDGFGAGDGDTLPDLPEDRTAAAEALAGIAAANRAVEDLVGPNPVPWLTRLRARKLTDTDADRLLEKVDWALSALGTLERRLDSFLPRNHPARPAGIGTAMHFLSELRDLAGRDREAGLCVRMAEEDRAVLDNLLDDIRHLAHTRRQLADALEGESQDDPAVSGAILAAFAAAETLRSEHECADLEQAKAELAGRTALDDGIRSSVRALTVFATRLDIPDATLGDLACLARATTHAKAAHPRTLTALRDVRQAPAEIISQASAKKARIERASSLLDTRFGSGWHQEPLDKLKRAASIANTPGDQRHPKVRDYARSFGVDVKIPESLTSVVKTRVAIDGFEDDATLMSVLPGTFRGLRTDFGVLLDASRLRAEIHDILGDCAGGDRLMSVFTSNSRAVINEFLEFAGLEDEADALPFPAQTMLRTVRESHDAAKAALAGAIAAVGALPVPPERRTMAEARRLGRMAREIHGTAARVTEHPALGRTGVDRPEQLLAALAWRDAVASLLPAPHTPSSDMDFAALLIHARDGLSQLTEWRATLRSVAATLGREELADDGSDFTAIRDGLDTLRAFETAIHAQVHVCEKMDAAIGAGLREFLARAASDGVAACNWSARLQSEYERLDRMRADEAFATEMTQAADDALEGEIDEAAPLHVADDPSVTEPGAEEVDQWFVEEIRSSVPVSGDGTAPPEQ